MNKIKSFPFMAVGVFLIAVVLFWTKIVALFKPKGYQNEVQRPLTELNELFIDRYWMAVNGHFITANGNGIVSKYNISQAQAHALQLADLMDTSKRDSWYERVFAFTLSPTAFKVKSILDPNYPSTYRRYVIQAYSDIYTNGRNLQSDVRSQVSTVTGMDEMLGLGGWNNDLTKYFKL